MASITPIFVVVDTDLTRAHQTINVLEERGKAVPCTRMRDLLSIQERESRIDALFIDDSIENLLEACEAIAKVFPSTVVYVTGSSIPLTLWPSLSGCGVRDFLKHPITIERMAKVREFRASDELNPKPNIAEKARVEIAAAAPTAASSILEPMSSAKVKERLLEPKNNTGTKVIVVTSAKGGEGKTTLIRHLADYYCEFDPVVVIDADSQGNLDNLFELDVDHHITEIEKTKPDKAYLDRLLTSDDESGVRVLASPIYQDMNLIKRQDLMKAIESYRKYYSVVIVDLAPGLSPLLATALDYATTVICVVTPDEKRLSRVEEHLSKLQSNLPSLSDVKFVINFDNPYPKVSDRVVRGVLREFGATDVSVIPFDKRYLTRSTSKIVFKSVKRLVSGEMPRKSRAENKERKHSPKTERSFSARIRLSRRDRHA